MTGPALRCGSVTTGHIRGRPCVRDVSFDVAPGSVVCLLGPNGAGKTTLLSSMSGILPRFSGDVLVDGESLPSGKPRSAVASGLVLVPDDRALFRKLSVLQHLSLAAPRSGGRAGIDEVLDHFPALRTRLKVAAGQLSGGEQQMLAIGRALIQRPRVLLIDELSLGLAPVVVASLLPILTAVARERSTAVVVVEQHVRMALEHSDRAVVLVHGVVALEADSEELRRDDSPIERAYLASRSEETVA